MKSLVLRIEDDLHEKLKKVAAEEDRSLNKTIIRAIKEYLQDK